MSHSQLPLTDDELKQIEGEYMPGVRGAGYRSLAKRLNRNENTIKKAIRRFLRTGSAMPCRRGRPEKLNGAEKRRVRARVDAYPFATNRELATLVEDRVTPQTIGNVLRSNDPPYTTKKAIDLEPREATEEWKETIRKFINNTLRRIPIARRIYADESPVYANEAKKKGRSPRGKKLFRVRPRHATRYTLHCYVRKTGVIYWELCEENATDEEIVRVVESVAQFVNDGDVLLWDQLGKSGRCRNPVSQHFNPEAISALKARGVRVVHLPPLGKYLDPLELLFNDLKEHYIRPKFPVQGQNLRKEELEEIIGDYMSNEAPRTLPGFFTRRANGKEILEQGLLE